MRSIMLSIEIRENVCLEEDHNHHLLKHKFIWKKKNRTENAIKGVFFALKSLSLDMFPKGKCWKYRKAVAIVKKPRNDL